MMPRDDKYNERLAYHEAGHALVAKWLGFNIIKCTIEKNKDTNAEGETIFIHPHASIITYILGQMGTSELTSHEDQIAYLMAGIAAVKLADFEETFSIEGVELSDDVIEARSDILKAKAIAAREYPGNDLLQDLVFISGRSKAEVILEGHIDMVKAIAMKLIEKTTLSGMEIDEIIQSLRPSGMHSKS